jgi:hypothetical protein
VARADRNALGGLIERGIYYVDSLCAIQILLGQVYDPPLAGGGPGKGGAYMLVYTVNLTVLVLVY